MFLFMFEAIEANEEEMSAARLHLAAFGIDHAPHSSVAVLPRSVIFIKVGASRRTERRSSLGSPTPPI